MSESTASAAASVTATAEAPAVDPNKGVDEFGLMAKAKTTGVIEQYNALASRVKAAEGDPNALLDNLRESYTEDEQVAKITAAIEEIDNKREALWAKRDQILKPIVERMVEEAKAGLGDTEAEAAALLKVAKSGLDYIKATYGEHAITDMPAISGKRRVGASGGTSGGTGQRRVRGYDVFVDGTLATSKDAQGNDKSNLAAAAKVLGVDTEDLRKAFFTAAGSDDSKQWPATVTFDVTVTVEGAQVSKHVVAKRTVQASGAPAVSAAANQDSQTAKAV